MSHKIQSQKRHPTEKNTNGVNNQEIESHFADMMEQMPLAFFAADIAGDLIYINPAGLELFDLDGLGRGEGNPLPSDPDSGEFCPD